MDDGSSTSSQAAHECFREPAPSKAIYRLTASELAALGCSQSLHAQLAPFITHGEITRSHVKAAFIWRMDWLAYAEGLIESNDPARPGCYRADRVTRISAGVRLREIEDTTFADRWLLALLVRGLSIPALGEMFYPDRPVEQREHFLIGTYSMLLEMLLDKHRQLDAERRKRLDIASSSAAARRPPDTESAGPFRMIRT